MIDLPTKKESIMNSNQTAALEAAYTELVGLLDVDTVRREVDFISVDENIDANGCAHSEYIITVDPDNESRYVVGFYLSGWTDEADPELETAESVADLARVMTRAYLSATR
jgi:hypothetical protein